MNKKGAFIVVFLMGAILIILFHKTVFNAGKVSFASGGDGIKSTFGTIYHLRHDTTCWHTMAMNYPFGESVFFTGNQVLFTNTLKLVQDLAGLDLSEKALGISNLWMLFSYVICALFVYLVMIELRLPWWYAVSGAIMITLLSTQWERFSGHYNLAYAYVIPVAVYILLRFNKKPRFLTSMVFGMFMLLISARHLYFTVFILVLIMPVWIFTWIREREKFGTWYNALLHFAVQVIIPLALFSIFSGMHEGATDRTVYPWGFYLSRMKPEAVLLPVGLPHGQLLKLTYPYRNTAYVSLLGTVVFLLIATRFFRYLFKKDYPNAFRIGDSPAFTWIFWGSVICFLLSLGMPFSLGYEKLLNYTGPFRQFRAIGRFAIPFYYVMTITALYLLWLWYLRSEWKGKRIVLVVALLAMSAESILHISPRPKQFRNTFEELNDWENTLEQDRWVGKHDWSQYQAIMPFPYFHIGSETYWINDESPAQEDAYFASIKTGLPLNSVMLSRTSISQSLLNMEFYYEPTDRYRILDHLPNRKPFLLLVSPAGTLNTNERRIIEKSTLLEETGKFKLYTFFPDSLFGIVRDFQDEMRNKTAPAEDTAWLYFNSYEEQEEGHFTAPVRDYTNILDIVIPDPGQYKVSFRMDKMDQDLWPRLILDAKIFDTHGNSTNLKLKDLFLHLVRLEGSWGVFEFDLVIDRPDTRLVINLKNRYLIRGDQVLDHLLIRPLNRDVVFEDDGKKYVNGRELYGSI